MSLRDTLKKAGLVTDGGSTEPSHSAPPPESPHTGYQTPTTGYQPAATSYQPPPPSYPGAGWAPPGVNSTQSNPDIVAKIKTSVIGTSPILTQFMKNVDLVRPQFPNDEGAAMRAALAFTQVDKNALLGELNRTVAAALLHTKSGLESDHKRAHDSAVGGLQTQLASVTEDINNVTSQISQLQSSIAAKQASAADLQNRIRDAENDLSQQDAVVQGSFAAVQQYVDSLNQTFSRL